MKQTITPDLLNELTDEKIFFKSSKMRALEKILGKVEKKKEKILIFVIRYSMQTLLKTALDKKYGLNITIINGKNNKRIYVDEKLEKFGEKDGFDIMILSPLAAGGWVNYYFCKSCCTFRTSLEPCKRRSGIR
jgi:hypothetical protein